MTNYYAILGVPNNATDEQIKDAYRKLCLKYHPDRSTLPNAAEMFNSVQEAYDFLSDPTNRRIYDAKLAEQEGQEKEYEDYKETIKTQGTSDSYKQKKSDSNNSHKNTKAHHEAKKKEDIPSSLKSDIGFGEVGSLIVGILIIIALVYHYVIEPRQYKVNETDYTNSKELLQKYMDKYNQDSTYNMQQK